MIKKILLILISTLVFIFSMVCCTNSTIPENEQETEDETETETSGEEFVFKNETYVQTFNDDFSGTKLDTRKWEKCPEWKRQDLGGYWEEDCSYVKDGSLIVECKKNGSKLVSGAVRTKGKFEQAEGLYKFRFKAEKSSGLWYAIWLMCDDEHKVGNGAVDGAEIDMIEILANDQWQKEGEKQYINSAVHWDGYDSNHKSKGSKHFITDNFFNEWHECVFVWDSEGYKLWLDDELIWDADGKDYGGTNTKPTYIKITAEFGKWGGPVDDSLLPAKMYVDYISAYKLK